MKITIAAGLVSLYTILAMKDSEGILIFAIGTVVACLLAWGLITAVKKSFSMPQPPKIDSSQTLQEQRQRSKDIVDKQKRLMEDQRQRLRDLQKR
ncbi:MAG: hypothetical protein HY210_00305 [Candidatus Omnitrophica bacterium]|nr:hypothetical protein [Candidatus Omnitrophota bacterium]MBI5024303.1 hypothetical protein [Candidatus Omnitrophota bacterium]